MEIPSLLRRAEHKALSNLPLSGTVVDLGGDRRATYLSLLPRDAVVTTVNIDPKTTPDVLYDLEQPLPFTDSTYDHALLINVLEHVFNYEQLLQEAVRVVKQQGTVVIVVPFLFPIHPSPHDYWRFSKEALEKLCQEHGLTIEICTSLGSGVFSARFLMIDRLLPLPLRAVLYVFRPLVYVADRVWGVLARLLGKKYNASDYALGYTVHAKKS